MDIEQAISLVDSVTRIDTMNNRWAGSCKSDGCPICPIDNYHLVLSGSIRGEDPQENSLCLGWCALCFREFLVWKWEWERRWI